MQDIFDDPHYRERGMILRVPDRELGTIAMTAPLPKLSETPAVVNWAGRQVGEDTERVLSELGGFTVSELADFERIGAIYCAHPPGDTPAPAASPDCL